MKIRQVFSVYFMGKNCLELLDLVQRLNLLQKVQDVIMFSQWLEEQLKEYQQHVLPHFQYFSLAEQDLLPMLQFCKDFLLYDLDTETSIMSNYD